MKQIYLIVILCVLTGIAAAQIEPDKTRFDVVLHPGDFEHKTVTLTNIGDRAIYSITPTAIGGDTKGNVVIDPPRIKDSLEPGDDIDMDIFFLAAPEMKPGNVRGFAYILDDAPPSIPIVLDFNITVVSKESYGVGLSINDALSAKDKAWHEEPAKFDILVKNMGLFRDVITLDVGEVPSGWTVSLLEGKRERSLPYDIDLSTGSSRSYSLNVEVGEEASSGTVDIIASSKGNRSKNATVTAALDVGLAVRGYEVTLDTPEMMVVNRSYTGSFALFLGRDERVLVDIASDKALLVVPSTQILTVGKNKAGSFNFTLMATEPAKYALLLRMVDSNGIPIPPEFALLDAVLPNGTVIITGSDLFYSTAAALANLADPSVPVVVLKDGLLSKADRDLVMPYAEVVLLGGESDVPISVENDLSDSMNVTRLVGADRSETSWLFAERFMKNASVVVVSGQKDVDILRSYGTAKQLSAALVMSGESLSGKSLSSALSMKNQSLKRAVLVGDVSENVSNGLRSIGVSVEVA